MSFMVGDTVILNVPKNPTLHQAEARTRSSHAEKCE